jgi:ABC-type nitrate/sulfonate/bicarbonate transport system substrate-binding protein
MSRGTLRRLFSPAVLIAVMATGALLGSPALGAPGEVPAAQTKGLRPLRVIGFVQYPPLVAAQEFGYFAAEGLDVSVDITPSSTFQMQGLTRGDWDLALTAFDNLLASATREGVQSVAFAITDVRNLPFLVRPEIQSYEDLRGKALAADAVDTALALVLRRLLLAHGLDYARGDYELLAVGGNPERLQSMLAGETVGAVLTPPGDQIAREAGFRQLGHHSEVLPDYPGSTMAATADWLRVPANRATAAGFLRAWRRGVTWVVNPANREAALDLVSARLGISRASAELLLDSVATDNAPNPAGFASVLNLRIDLGLADPPGPPIEPFYDLGIYEQATR